MGFANAGRSGGESSTGQKLSGETTTKSAYPAHTKDGRGQSYKPEQPVHIDINARLLETQSALRRDFPAHEKHMAARFRGHMVTPFSNAGVEAGRPFEGRTEFKRSYSATALNFH